MVFQNQWKESLMYQSISFGEYDIYSPADGVHFFESLLKEAVVGIPMHGPFESTQGIDLTGSAMRDLFKHHPRKEEILDGDNNYHFEVRLKANGERKFCIVFAGGRFSYFDYKLCIKMAFENFELQKQMERSSHSD
jgi:hypothetical protein